MSDAHGPGKMTGKNMTGHGKNKMTGRQEQRVATHARTISEMCRWVPFYFAGTTPPYLARSTLLLYACVVVGGK